MNWKFKKRKPEALDLSRELKIHPIVVNILLNRGYEDKDKIDKFINPSYSDLHSPFLMNDMQKAVWRILKAIDLKEKILLIGDYDVDGITGTIILYKSIKLLGGNVSYYIPHRLSHGYGIKKDDIKIVIDEDAKLVVTVDNGIKACEFSEELHSLGRELIITDHHEPEDKLPKATAILNPKLKNSGYPFRELSGSGVALKLSQAIFEKKEYKKIDDDCFVWASLGTIADMMPLIDENRAIVKIGLEKLRSFNHSGLDYIIRFSGLRKEYITSEDIAFRIAPRINVAGRLDSPEIVLKILMEENKNSVLEELTRSLNKLNSKRQSLVDSIVKEARSKIENGDYLSSDIVVVEGKEWHKGVIGVAAMRLAKEYGKPVLLISIEDGIGHGSGRSPSDIPVLKYLEEMRELFVVDGVYTFGGHSSAVGFKIPEENINSLKKKVESVEIEEVKTTQNDEIEVEAIILFNEINERLVQSLKLLEPFGKGNPKPVFASYKVHTSIISKRNGNYKLLLKNLNRTLQGFLRNKNIFNPQKNIFEIAYTINKKTSELYLDILDMK